MGRPSIEGGLSASRIRQAYQLVPAILESAVESGFLARSPCVGVALPKARRREMRFLSAPEVASLAKIIPEAYDTLFYLLAYGGLRWGKPPASGGDGPLPVPGRGEPTLLVERLVGPLTPIVNVDLHRSALLPPGCRTIRNPWMSVSCRRVP